MEYKDYYKILGVLSKDADDGTIKCAYRQLARQYFPDKNPGHKKAEEFQRNGGRPDDTG